MRTRAPSLRRGTRSRARRRELGVLGLAALLLPEAGAAQHPLSPDEVVLEDTVAVQRIDREVVAFDLEGSGRLSVRLELGEEVWFQAARGRVAIVLTNRRLLGVTPRSGSWHEERYRVNEVAPEYALLSQRLALAVTSQRALGFSGQNWFEESLGPREEVVAADVGPGAAVVVTDRRALALSPSAGGFFETKLQLRERIEDVDAIGGIATITTSQRTLVFKGPSGLWSEQLR